MVDMCKLLLPLTLLAILATGMEQATAKVEDQTKLYDEKRLQELQTENDRLRSEDEAQNEMKELLDRPSQNQREIHDKRMCNLKELLKQKEELLEFVATIRDDLKPMMRSFVPDDLAPLLEALKISDWKSWTADDVYRWIRGFGSHPAYARVATNMKEYGITGPELRNMMFKQWPEEDDEDMDPSDIKRRDIKKQMKRIRRMGFVTEGDDEKIAYDKMYHLVDQMKY